MSVGSSTFVTAAFCASEAAGIVDPHGSRPRPISHSASPASCTAPVRVPSVAGHVPLTRSDFPLLHSLLESPEYHRAVTRNPNLVRRPSVQQSAVSRATSFKPGKGRPRRQDSRSSDRWARVPRKSGGKFGGKYPSVAASAPAVPSAPTCSATVRDKRFGRLEAAGLERPLAGSLPVKEASRIQRRKTEPSNHRHAQTTTETGKMKPSSAAGPPNAYPRSTTATVRRQQVAMASELEPGAPFRRHSDTPPFCDRSRRKLFAIDALRCACVEPD